MSEKTYRHLSPSDRLKIYELLFDGLCIQKIATEIGFHKSSIYQERSRNSCKVGYRPDFASQQYFLRRHYKASKIDQQTDIKAYIIRKLKEGRSPEQISGLLTYDKGYQVIFLRSYISIHI